MSYDIYTGLLKAFPLPMVSETDVNFVYDNENPQFAKLLSRYPIETIAGNGEDISKAVSLLHWVSEHNYHKGNFNWKIAYNSMDLLDYAYDKGIVYGINCVGLATILTESLLAIGIKARKVFLMPCSPYDGDNHVVTHVYIREMGKWIMLDPTLNAYITNAEGKWLSLLELRNCLANQEPVFFNIEAKYNDDIWNEKSAQENIEYFAKNLFYFQTYEKSTFGEDNTLENRFITLSPKGYDPKQIRLSNIEYRIRKWSGIIKVQC